MEIVACMFAGSLLGFLIVWVKYLKGKCKREKYIKSNPDLAKHIAYVKSMRKSMASRFDFRVSWVDVVKAMTHNHKSQNNG